MLVLVFGALLFCNRVVNVHILLRSTWRITMPDCLSVCPVPRPVSMLINNMLGCDCVQGGTEERSSGYSRLSAIKSDKEQL